MSGEPFWSIPASELIDQLNSSSHGLSAPKVAEHRVRYGPNTVGQRARSNVPTLLLRQFTSPIVLLLVTAALLSFLLHDSIDAVIILAIVAMSGILGFWQEHDAARTVERLLAVVELRTTVVRDGHETPIPVTDLVPGDILVLAAGTGIPADCRVLASRDLFVDEATLTGESFPVEKVPGDLPADTPLSHRTNALFMGTHVISGSGQAVVVQIGRATELGRISERLRLRPPETEFEHGVRRFGFFLMEITLVLVVAIFAINVYLAKPVLDSFLFALALAVGLTPQLLPAVISVNLAKGAKEMAKKKVIVKRLAAIENFGSMDVLCSDKTGTLTEGQVRVQSARDSFGVESERVLFHAYVNAAFQTGFANPIDAAVRAHRAFDVTSWKRVDEVPYDFIRKRLSVLATDGHRTVMITKGAVDNVLPGCVTAEDSHGRPVPIGEVASTIREQYVSLSAQGFRTLGIATREIPGATGIRREDEQEMTFVGLLVLQDPPKAGVDQTVVALSRLGVSLKMISGDNALIAAQVAQRVGIVNPMVLTGKELAAISDDALPTRARNVNVFAEVEPNQKERIIRALRKAGHVVGYMGDGINDAPALHAADVSISVQQAVDVAKAAADIVLLEHDLGVLEQGVREGRRTFANTLKYVFMATSANFGNMFSMAGASLFLPFLPLLPKQILLTNLMTDVPELTIATDRVDSEWIERPHRWDVHFVRNFMLVFGALSSVFDYLTFGVLIWWLRASPEQFRTGWFLESVVSATAIVLIVRTRRSIGATWPSPALLAATLLVIAFAIALPVTPLGAVFGFVAVPTWFVGAMGIIVLLYLVTAEAAKRRFYRWLTL